MQDQISGEARQSGECESERLQFTSSSPHTKEKLIITLIFAKDESGTMEQHTFVRKKKKKGTKREKKKCIKSAISGCRESTRVNKKQACLRAVCQPSYSCS